jgi:hypothetical protein
MIDVFSFEPDPLKASSYGACMICTGTNERHLDSRPLDAVLFAGLDLPQKIVFIHKSIPPDRQKITPSFNLPIHSFGAEHSFLYFYSSRAVLIYVSTHLISILPIHSLPSS